MFEVNISKGAAKYSVDKRLRFIEVPLFHRFNISNFRNHLHHYTAEEGNRHHRRHHTKHKSIPISTPNGLSEAELKCTQVPNLNDQALSNSTDDSGFLFDSLSTTPVSKQEDNISTTSLPTTPTASAHNSKVISKR